MLQSVVHVQDTETSWTLSETAETWIDDGVVREELRRDRVAQIVAWLLRYPARLKSLRGISADGIEALRRATHATRNDGWRAKHWA